MTANWDSFTCDLWEDIESYDFYWNRMAFVYSLNVAADFADLIGEDGSQYRESAQEILPTAEVKKKHLVYQSNLDLPK